jgi:hypothetical protein
MDDSPGGFLTNQLSKLSRNRNLALAAEILFLLLIGATAVVLQSVLRYPFKLHGRHGLELIGLLMTGRMLSRRRWAATVSSVGAAAFSLLPILGFTDPLRHITFLLPGIIIDLGFKFSARSVPFMALLGAAAHVTKPIFRLIVAGFAYSSLASGVLYTIALHALFGAVGASVASLASKAMIRKSRPEG